MKFIQKIISAFPLSIYHQYIAKKNEWKEADYCLVSFPKCGRTWLNMMLKKTLLFHFGLESTDSFDLMFREFDARALKQKEIKLPKIHILRNHDDDAHWKKPYELEKSKRKYKNKKVILLVRDPRDVIVSAYFQQSKRVNERPATLRLILKEWIINGIKPYITIRMKPYKETLQNFIREETGSLETLLAFYNIWSENRHIPQDFLLVYYEDLHSNTHHELRRIAHFLGISSLKDETINQAVDYASFDNMRKMEIQNEDSTENILKPFKKEDEESFKTRKGKVSGFTDYLSQEDIEYLNKRIKESLSDFYKYKQNPSCSANKEIYS